MPISFSAGCYDATVIVGALSEGQVPSGVIPQLLLVTKPGKLLQETQM